MAATASRRNTLHRRTWLLWGLTFTLLLALTTAVPLLYLPAVDLLREGGEGAPIEGGWIAFPALAGLVIIFCLHTVMKQRELDAARAALEREEREKEQVRVRLSELSELFRVSTALNLALSLGDILEIIVRRVVSTLEAQQASVMIVDPTTGVLVTRASYGLEAEFARHARVRMGEGIAGWVAEQLKPVQLDPGNDTFGGHFKHNRHITSALSLPLRVGDRCVGVLNVNRINHTRAFESHHGELLEIFAEHVGAVIERAETLDRLGQETRALEADNRRLQDLHRMKDVFLGTATHELKTPLTSVIAYAELLHDNDTGLTHEQRQEFLGRLRAEAGRLLSLIDEILDLTRLESGKLVLKRGTLPLNEVAQAALETTGAFATRHRVRLVPEFGDGLPPVSVDEVKIRQVVTNLLVNAIKFSPEGGTVTVGTARDGDWITLEVADHGPGVPPEETAHIFELFGQGIPAGEERGGGLGIGLHLVKRITELHGGHVGVNSRQGEGSRFWIRLPLAHEPIPVAAAA
jgi:signal transduction histidine kinase